jgi:uncharacterized protein
MSGHLQTLAAENGLVYASDIITNGISLIPSIVKELVEDLAVTRFQVTLDGPVEIHDARRPTKSGTPTFRSIFRNVIQATKSQSFCERKCTLNLRCNVDQHNAEYIDDLIDMVIDAGLQRSLLMTFSPVVDWGEIKGSKRALSAPEFARREVKWLQKLLANDFKVQLLPKRRYGACMVVNPSSEVIDAYGKVYSCWEMPYTPTYQSSIEDRLAFDGQPEHPEDRVASEPPGNAIALISKDSMKWKLRNWHDELTQGDYGCVSCEFLPVCGGACPKSWVEGRPPCPSFKFNTPDKLALTILQSQGDSARESQHV